MNYDSEHQSSRSVGQQSESQPRAFSPIDVECLSARRDAPFFGRGYMFCTLSVVVAFLIGMSRKVPAELIERDWKTLGDGLLTFDQMSGREWLDLTLTEGMSTVEVSAQLDGNREYSGFTFASVDDVVELLTHAGIDTNTEVTEEGLDPAMHLSELLGVTDRGNFLFDWSVGSAFDETRGVYVNLGVRWTWELGGGRGLGGYLAPYDWDESPEVRGVWMFRPSEPRVIDGDLNLDGSVTVADIDLLNGAIRQNSTEVQFDLNSDRLVNEHDRDTWVWDIRKTWYGDANLDGKFDSSDLVAVFAAGEYEDDLIENSNWASGDWNGDAEFNSADLVVAFQDNGFEQGFRFDVLFVPEPGEIGCLPFAFAVVVAILSNRKLSFQKEMRQ